MKKIIYTFIFVSLAVISAAQTNTPKTTPTDTVKRVVQLSGIVRSADSTELPFASIVISGTRFLTVSNWSGFFSLAVKEGDLVIISYIGFRPSGYRVPEHLTTDKISIIKYLDPDTFELKGITIKPWPTTQEFNYAFVHTNIPDDDFERALKNLDPKKLEQVAMAMPRDGGESAKLYFQSVAQDYYRIGQTPPISILNPVAWYKFFQYARDGKFKKQD